MIGSEGRRNQGVALGIGGWAGPVEFVPETTHTTNGLATFSRGLVASAEGCWWRTRASSLHPAFASVDEWNAQDYVLVVERGRRAAYLPRVTSFGATDEPHGSYRRRQKRQESPIDVRRMLVLNWLILSKTITLRPYLDHMPQ